jgi:hypothetical protein
MRTDIKPVKEIREEMINTGVGKATDEIRQTVFSFMLTLVKTGICFAVLAAGVVSLTKLPLTDGLMAFFVCLLISDYVYCSFGIFSIRSKIRERYNRYYAVDFPLTSEDQKELLSNVMIRYYWKDEHDAGLSETDNIDAIIWDELLKMMQEKA